MALNSLDEELLQGPIGGSMLERFRSFIAEAAAAASQVSGSARYCATNVLYILCYWYKYCDTNVFYLL